MASAHASVENPYGSPYWRGLRVSVVIPTYNRKDKLRRCLDALAKQTILPQEFEVVVVDDGSSDGTAEEVRAAKYPFAIQVERQSNQGQGEARNNALGIVRGELVLYIGDDIYPHPRLLEAHLEGHAQYPEPNECVLGFVDWADIELTPVMRYVCGDGGQQFAYKAIPHLPQLDYRFFYTSNISLKRRFLLEARDAGIRFDRCFRHYGFEDTDFGMRLEGRGLRIRYRGDAIAYHDHWMDFEAFLRREHLVGRMAVVLWRKHPRVDADLRIRWIGDRVADVERLAQNPELADALRKFDRTTDESLRASVAGLEAILEHGNGLVAGGDGSVERSLHRLYETAFEVARVRGKVEEWYGETTDAEMPELAKALFASERKIDLFRPVGAPAPALPAPAPGPVPMAVAAAIDGGHIQHAPELAHLNRNWIIEPGGIEETATGTDFRSRAKARVRKLVAGMLSGYLLQEREFFANLVRFQNDVARRLDQLSDEIRNRR